VPTPLVIQAVESDGVTPIGNGTVLLDNNGAGDGGTVEAPSLVQIGSTYVLFFSSGCFATETYTVSYATSSSITGPYTRAPAPLFDSGDYGLVSPGGMSIDPDGEHMVFHARLGTSRALYNALISFAGGNG
jgi:beta-xylosidase